jgi:hypothetical protein
MKKVYRVIATRVYSVEVIAIDGDDALQIAEQLPENDWDEGNLNIEEVELITGDTTGYFGEE